MQFQVPKDETLALARAKVALTEIPFKVSKNVYQLLDLQAESEKLKQLAMKGPLVVTRQHFSFFGFKFWRPALKRQEYTSAMIKAELAKLQLKFEKLKKDDLVEGFLTPLTVGDDYEINAHFIKARAQVKASFKEEETTPEGIQAKANAIELVSNLAYISKRVECAMKQKVPDGGFVRLKTHAEVTTWDPRVLTEIWKKYVDAFELTDAELGK